MEALEFPRVSAAQSNSQFRVEDDAIEKTATAFLMVVTMVP